MPAFSIPLLFALAYPVCLVWAAISDVRTMTIPNRLNLVLAAAFFPAALLLNLPLADIGIHTALGLAGLVLGMGMFAFSLLGGGDAKLIPATALWLGLDGVVALLIYTALAGGALAIGIILARKLLWSVAPKLPPWLARHLDPKGDIPYGVAICAGGLLAIPHSQLWLLINP